MGMAWTPTRKAGGYTAQIRGAKVVTMVCYVGRFVRCRDGCFHVWPDRACHAYCFTE